VERKQSRKFLECVEDNFLTQMVKELTRKGTLLDLFFVNREGLLGDVMVGGCLGHSDHGMTELLILREVRRGVSRTATLDFWRADFGLQTKSALGGSPEGQMSPGRLDALQEGSLKEAQKAIPMCRKMSQWGRRLAWLNRDLWLELTQKKRLYDLWKKMQTTQEDYKDVMK